MKHKKVTIITSVAGVFLVGAAAFFLLGGVDKVKALFGPKEQVLQSVTLEGKVTCLPHKTGETSTLECAVGLLSDEKYYGLSSTYDTELSEAAGSDRTVKVSGKLEPQTSDTYTMAGVIAVSDFEFVN